MTFKDLQKSSERIRAAAAFESFAPRRLRRKLKEILLLLIPAALVVSMFFPEVSHLTIERLYGTLLAILFLSVFLFMLDFFFYSMYFEGIKTTLHERGFPKNRIHTPYEVLFIVLHTKPEDVTVGFSSSLYGHKIFRRLNIEKQALENFLKNRSTRVKAEALVLPNDPTLASYAGAIFDADKELAEFLSRYGFYRREMTSAADWVARIIDSEKNRLRWWSRDSLGRIRGVGKEWARIEAHNLLKYGKYLEAPEVSYEDDSYCKEVSALERVLVAKKESNALIIGEQNDDVLEVVEEFARQIEDGTVLNQLEHKNLFLLDDTKIISSTASKTDLERELVKILVEATKAQNIIFIIPNFAAFVSAAESFGVDIMQVFEPYLRDSNIQIIALTNKELFMRDLQKNTALMSHFEKILIDSHAMDAILHRLEQKVEKIERKTKLFFTYPALLAMAEKNVEKFEKYSPAFLDKLILKKAGDEKKVVTANDVRYI